MDLGGGAEWGEMRLPDQCDLWVAQADIKDYFHCCMLPPWLSDYFCLPRVSGAVLIRLGVRELEGEIVRPEGEYFSLALDLRADTASGHAK